MINHTKTAEITSALKSIADWEDRMKKVFTGGADATINGWYYRDYLEKREQEELDAFALKFLCGLILKQRLKLREYGVTFSDDAYTVPDLVALYAPEPFMGDEEEAA